MLQNTSVRKLYFKDTTFAELMKHRIYNILLISSKYDAFILEEDGRIDEQIFNEYTGLNLRYPPRFILVDTEAEALSQLKQMKFELIIAMSDSEGKDIIDLAQGIKSIYSETPIVVLTPFLRDVSLRIFQEDLSVIDYVFSWLGNSDLLLAIIKLVEDRMNVDEDIESVGVQTLIFVEDSIRYTSSMLPYLYKFVFHQSRSFMAEALNEHEQMLRMRGRPKILWARNYNEAYTLYRKYKKNVLGIISDIRFKHNGKLDPHAGIDLCRQIRSESPFIPYILESSEVENKIYADELEVPFLNKGNEKTLPVQLKKLLLDNFGFGDFIFRNPETLEEVKRAANLKAMQTLIGILPEDVLAYHFRQNHISRWLYSRAMFPLAEFVENISLDDYPSVKEVRTALLDAIAQYRKIKNRGVVAIFQRDRFDQYSNFARIGSGSMGGKGRGLAFLDSLIKRNISLEDFWDQKVSVTLPKTVVICTDIFDEFMENNNLYPIAMSDISNEEILKHFLEAKLARHLLADFLVFFQAITTPIAVRSSSLLEDSYYQPFAGIYSTYMIPYVRTSKTHMLTMLSNAIKAVYASVFFKESKAYMASTSSIIDSEKMAIVLQEVVGSEHQQYYYPSFSGVARSINFYPIGPEEAADGICNVALGLGKYVVDGGLTLRFSPRHPQNILQTSDLSIALRETQTKFLAIDLKKNTYPTTDDGENLAVLDLKTAEADGTLRWIASTFDPNDNMIRDGIFEGGRKLITFSNILKHGAFPLAKILENVLKIGQHEMGHPVEVEFAVNLNYSGGISNFYLLQIRPIVQNKETIEEDIEQIKQEETIISSNHSLGNGIIDNIYDIIYVKPQSFNASANVKTAYEIEELNKKLSEENRGYALIGPGRWGSGDSWLGIPVRWSQISSVRVLVEAGLANYRVDPSQGTHFFHNLTAFRVAYFSINPYKEDGYYNHEYLDQLPAIYESDQLRHVRLNKPAIVKVDGKKGKGVIELPM